MRTKICGITSYEDAMTAIEAGADALGFVFYKKSPRYISIENAKSIISQLPPFIEKVALFVNESASTINTVCKESGSTLAQLHFDIAPELTDALEVPYIKVTRAKNSQDILEFAGEYRLVDAYCETYGGAGKRINLEWFDGVDCSKIILAGGLNSSNLATLREYGFFGLDVSSGVEISHGKKDPQKVKDFIKNAQ
jgi:phosphoribosylanthranilate isomerase